MLQSDTVFAAVILLVSGLVLPDFADRFISPDSEALVKGSVAVVLVAVVAGFFVDRVNS